MYTIFFSKDGDKMYIVGLKEIFEYALNIPFGYWDVENYVGKIEREV